jgi:hypothetical protein
MRLALALTLALAFPLTAQADSYEERLAVANEHIEATLEDINMADVIAQMYTPLLTNIEQQTGKKLTQAQIDAIDKLYQDNMSEPMTQLMREQSKTMADIMTMEEIVALRDFYQTPDGRSVMTKLPKLIEVQQPQVMAMVQNNLPKMMPQLQAIVEGN